MKEKQRILVVDDDPGIRRLLSKILERDYLTDTAGDAAAAKQHLAARAFHLILADLLMPGESGESLIRFVRCAYPDIAVVVVSGVSAADKTKNIIDAGVYGYIVKPFEPNQIRISVENALRLRNLEMRRQLDQKTLREAVNAGTAELAQALDALRATKRQSDMVARDAQTQLALMNTMADAIPNPLFYKDPSSTYVGCNKAFARLLRRPVREIIGKTDVDIASEDTAAKLQKHDAALLTRAGKETYDAIFLHDDGDLHAMIVNKATCLDAHGRIFGVVGIMLDITERRAMEKRLMESETRFRRLVEGSLQGILIHQHLKPVFVNKAFAKIYGYTEADILALPDIRNLIAETECNRSIDYGMDCRRGNGIPDYYEYHSVRKNGTGIWLECRAMVVAWEEGRAVQLTVSDITARKRNEAALMESEARLKTLWESIQTGVLVMNVDTRKIMDVNPTAAAMIGLPAKDIVGRPCHNFICPNGKDQCPVVDLGLDIHKMEHVMVNAQGRPVPVIKTATRNTLNGTRVLIESLVDISSLKKAEAELENAHRAMVELISGITSIFVGLSPSLTVVQWNDVAERVFNIPSGRVLNQPLCSVDIPWDVDRIREALTHCIETRRPVDLDDMAFDRPDGTKGFLGLRITAIGADRGRPAGLLLMGADITKKKMMESQLAQAQKLESIGQLAAGIAHEINTPIQYVGDNIRFLKDAFATFLQITGTVRPLLSAAREGAADAVINDIEARIDGSDFDYFVEEVPAAIEQTLEGVGRISRIVRSMKEFSHPGTDEKISVDINKALESTVSVSRNEWKYVADIETDFDPSLPMVVCFPGELNQVFLNMIINAAHAVESAAAGTRTEKGCIRISTRDSGDAVEVRISDTGCGIPESIRHRIFDPFFTTKEVGKGTGQGLAIAHRIVTEKHHGQIRFETETGKGTTFIMRIPYGEEMTESAETDRCACRKEVANVRGR